VSRPCSSILRLLLWLVWVKRPLSDLEGSFHSEPDLSHFEHSPPFTSVRSHAVDHSSGLLGKSAIQSPKRILAGHSKSSPTPNRQSAALLLDSALWPRRFTYIFFLTILLSDSLEESWCIAIGCVSLEERTHVLCLDEIHARKSTCSRLK
jgi:hypothetical protein